MAKKKRKKDSPAQGSVAILLIIGILITVYFALILLRFLNQNSVHYMVAEKGTLEQSFTVRAVLTRDESLVRASADGVVRYDYPGGEKLAANTRLGVLLDAYYGELLDKKIAQVYQELEEQNVTGGADFAAVESEMLNAVASYLRTKDDSRDSLYRLKDSFSDDCRYRRELFALSANKRVLALLDEEGIYLKEQENEQSNLWLRSAGIVEYSYDGYEGWTYEQVGENFIANSDGIYSYLDVSIRNRTAGEVLYRVINSEDWYLTAFLTPAQAALVSGREEITFLYNGSEEMTAGTVSLTQSGELYKLVLRMRSRMQAHDTERTAELTFVMDSLSGIKISSDCLTQGDYYYLPAEYVVRQGSGRAVMKLTADGIDTVPVSCIWNDGSTFYFLLPEGLSVGDSVMKEGSTETMQVGAHKLLTGVYVVNGLNEVFEAVTVLYEDGGYCIVEGISTYDRVKLEP